MLEPVRLTEHLQDTRKSEIKKIVWGSISAPGACRATFFDHSPPVPVFAPTSPNNLEYVLAMCENLAHPLHPVIGDGKGGGWKWWK